jgi:hypothetical protein
MLGSIRRMLISIVAAILMIVTFGRVELDTRAASAGSDDETRPPPISGMR